MLPTQCAQKLSIKMNVELVGGQKVFGRHADGITSQPRSGYAQAVTKNIGNLGKLRSLNFSHFVAHKIWRERGLSPLRGRAHRLQRRKPLRCLLVPMDTTFDLLQTAIN